MKDKILSKNLPIVVSFSGGATSGYTLKLVQQLFSDTKLQTVENVFMDVGAEHPKTYDFVRNIDQHFNANVTCLRLKINPSLGKGNSFNVVSLSEIGPDLQPWKDMLTKYGVPYFGGAFCTDRMKLGPFKKYCKKKYKNYVTVLGIRFDEPKRLWGTNKKSELCCYTQLKKLGFDDESMSELFVETRKDLNYLDLLDLPEKTKQLLTSRVNKLDSDNIHYLAELSDFTKQDVINWWKKQEFQLGLDEWLGNCVFCIKKSDLKIAAAYVDEPDFYQKYLSVLEDDSVRIDDKTGDVNSMYRQKRHIKDVIGLFDGSSGQEIKDRIRGAKMLDTGSCSESCELYN